MAFTRERGTLTRNDPASDAARQLERQLAEELEELPGILAAVVWLDLPGSRLNEALLALGPGTDAGQTRAAAIELLEQHGISASPTVIRAEPLDGRSASQPTSKRAKRFLRLEDLELHRVEGQAACRVTLRCDGAAFVAEAREPDSPHGRARAAARATLDAAHQAVPRARLGLDAIAFVNLSAQEHIAVVVEAATDRTVTFLVGIATVRTSPEDAASHAALDATERWLSA